jgi:hypothetical protein
MTLLSKAAASITDVDGESDLQTGAVDKLANNHGGQPLAIQ